MKTVRKARGEEEDEREEFEERNEKDDERSLRREMRKTMREKSLREMRYVNKGFGRNESA